MGTSTSGKNQGGAGYHYQATASLYQALKLMLQTRSVMEVTVEPENYEDMATTEMDTTSDDVVARMTVPAKRRRAVVYQMKTLSHKVWTVASFSKVLTRGAPSPDSGKRPRQRASALQLLLDDETLHYHFITNAAVESELASLARPRTLLDPLPDGLLPELYADKREKLRGRIEITAQSSERLLRNDTVGLLCNAGRVPYRHAENCRLELWNIFWGCIADTRSNLVFVDEVLEVMKKHGARPAGMPAPDYVPPANADRAAALLRQERCVIIVGPPDIGKAALADYLAVAFELAEAPCPQVTLRNLDELEYRLSEPGPALLIAKNGWTWADTCRPNGIVDLAEVFAPASADKHIIVTCDTPAYQRVLKIVTTIPEAFVIRLGLEDYDDDSRWKIVTNNARLEGWRLCLLETVRQVVLDELAEPRSLMLFGVRVREHIDRMVEPETGLGATSSLSTFDDDFPHDAAFWAPPDSNIALLRELISDARRDTVGKRTLFYMRGFEHASEKHAALLLGIFVLFGYGAVLDLHNDPGRMDEIAGRVATRTKQPFILAEYIEYLIDRGVLLDKDGVIHTLDEEAFDALRLLVHQAKTVVHPVLMAVACEFVDTMRPDNFAMQLRGIEALVETAYDGAPIPGRAWIDVVASIDKHFEDALRVVDREVYLANVDAAMDWQWSKSPYGRLLYELHPDRLRIEEKGTPEATRRDVWCINPYEIFDDPVPSFVRRFLLDFMPYTDKKYAHVSRKFVAFLRASGEVREEDVHAALHALEAHAFSPCYDDDYDGGLEWTGNRQVLVSLLDAIGSRPFETRFPALRDWEL